MRTYRARGIVAVTFFLLALSLTACGSSGGSSSSQASGNSPTGGSKVEEGNTETSGDLTSDEIEAILTATQESTNTDPPTSGPKAVPGKTITAIVYGLEAESGKTFAEGIEKAGSAIGWNVKVIDGEFSASKYTESIRKAVAEKVDGIVTYVIDCPSVQAAAVEAKKAGIPLIYAEGYDCNELGDGPETAFSLGTYHTFDKNKTATFKEYITAAGELQGAAAWKAAEGKVSAIALNETDAHVTEDLTTGFMNVINSCSECSVEKEIDFVGGDLGPALQEKTEQALLQAPDANTLFGNYDDPVIDSAGPAVRSSGRGSSIFITGTAGYAPYMELIRNGEADMTVGLPVEWFAWASLDRFNRIFGGEMEEPQTGMGLSLIDEEDNLPPEGQSWKPTINYEADYKKIWGVG
jgi:ribose transport system substrate-binding protein